VPEQEALVQQPGEAGLWRRFIADGAIAEAPWRHACAEGGPVGNCACGAYLFARRPETVAGRTDYTAECRSCGKEISAPGGRLRTRR